LREAADEIGARNNDVADSAIVLVAHGEPHYLQQVK
jgi:hypothetical protein